ncbi:capsule assembly Wzi family protein [Lutibacter sp.]
MKNLKPFIIIFCGVIQIITATIQAQEKNEYTIDLTSFVATENTLPFWFTANQFGTVPNENTSLLNASFKHNNTGNATTYFTYKAGVAGFTGSQSNVFITELYGSLHYKNWKLTLGNKYDPIAWEGLSSTNGNIVKATNTRAFPGIALETKKYIRLPFAKSWLRAKFSYAEYLLNDKRVVDNAQLHHKSVYFKSLLNSKLSLVTGLDHYAVWGGTSNEFGKLPSGFNDYIKVVLGSSGGNNAAIGDQINALGNHIGAYLLQLNYKGTKVNWNMYWSHPFEDTSGMNLSNYPDALYGIFIDFKKPKSFITHLVAEYYYTKDQGRKASTNGLSDNYFNNSIYNSGWTYFGNTIGSPFFPTKVPVDGITHGVIVGYNRFVAYHLGTKGYLAPHIRYTTMMSYIYYAGWFGNPVENNKQLSGVLTLYFQPVKLPFDIAVGTAIDAGNFLPHNIGGFIKLTKKGIF